MVSTSFRTVVFWFVIFNFVWAGVESVRLTALLHAEKAADAENELKKLQGTWRFVTLEIGGTKMPAESVKGAKIIVTGDRFTTVSMGATYKGTLKVDASRSPKTLDMHFTEGPEKGNTSLAIYELDGDNWKLCLGVTAKNRPTEFAAKAGSGLALETLRKETANDAKDDEVKKEVEKLAGEWTMVSGEREGQPFPDEIVKTGKRVTKGNETTAEVGGQVVLKATFTVDPSKNPKTIDYAVTEGQAKDQKIYGIYKFDGDKVTFCFASPGTDRPTDFKTKEGDQRTMTVWTKAKK